MKTNMKTKSGLAQGKSLFAKTIPAIVLPALATVASAQTSASDVVDVATGKVTEVTTAVGPGVVLIAGLSLGVGALFVAWAWAKSMMSKR